MPNFGRASVSRVEPPPSSSQPLSLLTRGLRLKVVAHTAGHGAVEVDGEGKPVESRHRFFFRFRRSSASFNNKKTTLSTPIRAHINSIHAFFPA